MPPPPAPASSVSGGDRLEPVDNIKGRLRAVLQAIDTTLYKYSEDPLQGSKGEGVAALPTGRVDVKDGLNATPSVHIPPTVKEPAVQLPSSSSSEKGEAAGRYTVPPPLTAGAALHPLPEKLDTGDTTAAAAPVNTPPKDISALAPPPEREKALTAWSPTIPVAEGERDAADLTSLSERWGTTSPAPAPIPFLPPYGGSSFLQRYSDDLGPPSTTATTSRSSRVVLETHPASHPTTTTTDLSKPTSSRSSVDGMSPVRRPPPLPSSPWSGAAGSAPPTSPPYHSMLEETDCRAGYTILKDYLDRSPVERGGTVRPPRPAPAAAAVLHSHEVDTPRRVAPARPKDSSTTFYDPNAEGIDIIAYLKSKRERDLSALSHYRKAIPSHSVVSDPPLPPKEKAESAVKSSVNPYVSHDELLTPHPKREDRFALTTPTPTTSSVKVTGEAERAVRRRMEAQKQFQQLDKFGTTSSSMLPVDYASYQERLKGVRQREMEYADELIRRSEHHLLESMVHYENTKLRSAVSRGEEAPPSSSEAHAIRRYANQLKRLKAFYEGSSDILEEGSASTTVPEDEVQAPSPSPSGEEMRAPTHPPPPPPRETRTHLEAAPKPTAPAPQKEYRDAEVNTDNGGELEVPIPTAATTTAPTAAGTSVSGAPGSRFQIDSLPTERGPNTPTDRGLPHRYTRQDSGSSIDDDEHTQLPGADRPPTRKGTKAAVESPPPRSASLAASVSSERLYVSPSRKRQESYSSDSSLSSEDIPVDAPLSVKGGGGTYSSPSARPPPQRVSRGPSHRPSPSPAPQQERWSPSRASAPLSEEVQRKHMVLSAALAEMSMMQAASTLKEDGVPLYVKQLSQKIPAKAFLSKDERELTLIVERIDKPPPSKPSPKTAALKPTTTNAPSPSKWKNFVPFRKPSPSSRPVTPPPSHLIPVKRPPPPPGGFPTSPTPFYPPGGKYPMSPPMGFTPRPGMFQPPPNAIPIRGENGRVVFLDGNNPRFVATAPRMAYPPGPPSLSRTNSMRSAASTMKPPPSPTSSILVSGAEKKPTTPVVDASPKEKVLIREKHHFPLRNARLMLPFAVIGNESDLGEGGPRTWEDVCGVWGGPAACELLRRYRCTIFPDVRAPVYHDYRVYLLVPDTQRGELPKEAVLLVLDFNSRVEMITFILGIQAAKGGKPLSYGRVLWMLAVQRIQRARSLLGMNPFDMDCIWRGVAPSSSSLSRERTSKSAGRASRILPIRDEWEDPLPRLRRRGKSPSPSLEREAGGDRLARTTGSLGRLSRWRPFTRSASRRREREEREEREERKVQAAKEYDLLSFSAMSHGKSHRHDREEEEEEERPLERTTDWESGRHSVNLAYSEPKRRSTSSAVKAKVRRLFQKK